MQQDKDKDNDVVKTPVVFHLIAFQTIPHPGMYRGDLYAADVRHQARQSRQIQLQGRWPMHCINRRVKASEICY